MMARQLTGYNLDKHIGETLTSITFAYDITLQFENFRIIIVTALAQIGHAPDVAQVYRWPHNLPDIAVGLLRCLHSELLEGHVNDDSMIISLSSGYTIEIIAEDTGYEAFIVQSKYYGMDVVMHE